MLLIKNRALHLIPLIILTGCAAHTEYFSINPEWNPVQGIEWASAQCEARASGVVGYDWIDNIGKSHDAYHSCMKSYGYDLRYK